MAKHRAYTIVFADVYPLLVEKVTRKGRTQAEVDQIIFWLTGYDAAGLQQQIQSRADYEAFFAGAPHFHSNASKITGSICGYRVEEIEDPVVQKVRYLDKLVDELAKGKHMDKILRA